MTCHDAREQFSAWIDETAPAVERDALAAHLDDCAECRQELARFGAAVRLVRNIERPRAPAGFVERVVQAARPLPWHRRLGRRLFVPISVKIPAEAVALLLIAGLAVYVFHGTPALQRAAHESQASNPLANAPVSTSRPSARSPEPRSTARVTLGLRLDQAGRDEALRQTDRDEAARRSEHHAPDPPSPPSSVESNRLEATRDVEPERGDRLAPRPGNTPALEGRTAARERSMLAPTAAAPRAMSRLATSADVVGRLTVTDRKAAESALDDLLVRTRGVRLSRHEETASTVVELAVPRAGYAELSEGLGRIGRWQSEGEPPELPAEVRLSVRLAE